MTEKIVPLDEAGRARMRALFSFIATDARPCLKCARMLYFVTTKTGKRMPVTDDGISHFVDCPHADSFRRKKT